MTAAQRPISRVVLVWTTATTVSLARLPHGIAGSVEVAPAALSSDAVTVLATAGSCRSRATGTPWAAGCPWPSSSTATRCGAATTRARRRGAEHPPRSRRPSADPRHMRSQRTVRAREYRHAVCRTHPRRTRGTTSRRATTNVSGVGWASAADTPPRLGGVLRSVRRGGPRDGLSGGRRRGRHGVRPPRPRRGGRGGRTRGGPRTGPRARHRGERDQESKTRSSEAADAANLDNHRDQPPHGS